MNWIFIGDEYPPEDEYILACAGEDCPVFITRLHNAEWEQERQRNPCFRAQEKFYTGADPVYWMKLPVSPTPRKLD